MHDIFVDRLSNVAIGNGVARLDFLRMEVTDTDKQKVTMQPSVRVAIPLDGLLQAIQMLERLRDQLVAQAGQQVVPAQNPAAVT